MGKLPVSARCRQGLNIGGNMYPKLGVMTDYFAFCSSISVADLGRLNIPQREEDRHFFRVRSRRKVTLTPPCRHDGSAKTLEDSVNTMAGYPLGRELETGKVSKIVAFLRTLTGEYLGQPVE